LTDEEERKVTKEATEKGEEAKKRRG